MKRSDSIAKLAVALVAVQAELKSIVKDSTNPHFHSKFVSLDTLIDTVRPVLVKWHFALVQGAVPDTDENGTLRGISVETMLLHESGEWISNVVAIPLEKPTAQGVGSAITYGRRYGASCLLCTTADDDDDGTAASERKESENGKRFPDLPAKKPEDKVMPFGKPDVKGKKLGEIPTDKLASALEWCREKDAAKFKDLIESLETVLENRRNKDAERDGDYTDGEEFPMEPPH